jgi:hypothetical protein
MADLSVHGVACACREDRAIDQCQSCVELVGERDRPTAVISESSRSRQSVLIPARPPEARLHPPTARSGPGGTPNALLDGREECRIGLLERTPGRDDGRSAAFHAARRRARRFWCGTAAWQSRKFSRPSLSPLSESNRSSHTVHGT